MTQQSVLNLLSRPCSPPTDWGRRNIAALHTGKLPPKLKEWPVPSLVDKKLSTVETAVLDSIQMQVDAMAQNINDHISPAGNTVQDDAEIGFSVLPAQPNILNSLDDPEQDISEFSDSD